jgi:MYXO-CTERM domain-containing protein
MADTSGNNANYRTGSGPFPIDSGNYYATLVGEFQNSASPYGTFDQGGNVVEWDEAVIGSYHGLRGGSFENNNLGLISSDRDSFYIGYPTDEFSSVGFRVSQVPEPATALLLLAALPLLRRRRERIAPISFDEAQ